MSRNIFSSSTLLYHDDDKLALTNDGLSSISFFDHNAEIRGANRCASTDRVGWRAICRVIPSDIAMKNIRATERWIRREAPGWSPTSMSRRLLLPSSPGAKKFARHDRLWKMSRPLTYHVGWNGNRYRNTRNRADQKMSPTSADGALNSSPASADMKAQLPIQRTPAQRSDNLHQPAFAPQNILHHLWFTATPSMDLMRLLPHIEDKTPTIAAGYCFRSSLLRCQPNSSIDIKRWTAVTRFGHLQIQKICTIKMWLIGNSLNRLQSSGFLTIIGRHLSHSAWRDDGRPSAKLSNAM